MPTLKLIQRKKRTYKRYNENEKRKIRIRFYNKKDWKLLREKKLSIQPLCEQCQKKGIITVAEDVHHIKNFTIGNTEEEMLDMFLNINNLMSLCKKCHGEIHQKTKNNKIENENLDENNRFNFFIL